MDVVGDVINATQVYFHIVSKDTTLAGGNVPYVLCSQKWSNPPDVDNRDSQIQDQISVINNAYSSTGISWVLAGTTRTINADWFDRVAPNNNRQTAMKALLRTGGVADLNVYTVGLVTPSNIRCLLIHEYQLYSFKPPWIRYFPFKLCW